MKSIRLATPICIVIVALFCSCSVFCWQKNVVQHGIHFKKIRQERGLGIYIGLTDSRNQIEGFQVEKGWVHFHPDWKLKAFQTAAPVDNHGLVLPTGTWVFLDREGQISNCVLPESQNIQGIRCRGGGGVSGITTSFYPSGRLKGAFPASDIVVDGIPCSNTVFYQVTFYENGHLKSCRLSKACIAEGITYKKGARISIDPAGKITLMH
jgi:hypothetical protein